MAAGYGNDVVTLTMTDPVRFYVNLTGDERDNTPSPLEGRGDVLTLRGNIDPTSMIIKFEVQSVSRASVATAAIPIRNEDGAEYWEVDGVSRYQIFMPVAVR